MQSNRTSKSTRIRNRLSYPVIDSDSHALEIGPLFMDYLRAAGGPRVAERFRSAFFDSFVDPRWASFSVEERRERRTMRPTWRALPAKNTLDLATAMFPKLMYERLEEMGLDFSVVYPTISFLIMEIQDEELRCAAARAMNHMKADEYQEFRDRLAPVATITMHTPQEAIEELEHAVKELGFKAAMVASFVKRPIPAVARSYPELGKYAYWMDTFGLDSDYDYDSFWAKCLELRISPTFHSIGYGWGTRTSISNYIHNHLGNFAASAEAICRGLFMGGVPKRFPGLTFAFLEGGMSWARNLYSDLIGHWHKRNREAIENYNPANIDRALLTELIDRYGGHGIGGRATEVLELFPRVGSGGEDPRLVDEWAPSGIGGPEEIRDIFVKQFYFGCEGDDPLNALAFRPQGTPFNAKLNALYGSDIGHWDVPDMRGVLAEAYELLEHGTLTEEELRQLLFVNSVKFWVSSNPEFFKGTAVENEVNKLIADGLE